jgi:hypothetical protein
MKKSMNDSQNSLVAWPLTDENAGAVVLMATLGACQVIVGVRQTNNGVWPHARFHQLTHGRAVPA